MSGNTCSKCPSGYTTVSSGSVSFDQCLYLCTSPSGAGCCQSKVLVSSTVTALDNIALTFADLCPDGYTYNANFKKCYKFYTTPATWTSAQATCVADGATLVNIQSEAENNYISGQNNFVGFNDIDVEGTWKWVKNSNNLQSATQESSVKQDLSSLIQSTGSLYARYEAQNYNTQTNVWTDSSSNSRNIFITQKGTLSLQTRESNGQLFKVLSGGTSSSIQLLCNSGLTDYTLFHVARYTGGTKGRIITNDLTCDGRDRNWLSGFWYILSL